MLRHSRSAQLEIALERGIRRCNLPPPKWDMQFDPHRGWRADFGWPDRKLLVDIVAETGVNSGHDCEKHNEAVFLGFRVLRFTVEQVRTGAVFEVLQRALNGNLA